MAFNAGEIVIELNAKDGGFTAQVKNAGALMRSLKVDMEATAKSVKRLEQDQFSLGTKFRNMIIMLGNLRFALMDLNDAFVRLPMAILKTSGELERIQQLMTGLSKETEKAARAADGKRMFDFVVGMAQNAPFEIAALGDAFVKLRTGGLDPTKGSMQALVDAVSRFGGTSETLKRASVAIQQMLGKGVISMEELRQQLGEAVPTAMQDMADSMGLSMSRLTDLVSKGVVRAQGAIDKMLVTMATRNKGAAADMMDTWVGTTARLQTQFQLMAKVVADAGFAPAVKEIANQLIELMRGTEFQRFATDFGSNLALVVKGLAAGVKFLYEWADAIKAVAVAWLGWKLAKGIIEPLITTMQQQQEAFRKTAAEGVAARNAVAAAAKQGAVQEASAALVTSQVTQRTFAEKLQALKAEKVMMDQHHRELIARASAMGVAYQNAVNAGRPARGADFGLKGVISQADALKQLQLMEQMVKTSTASRMQVADNIRIQEAAYGFLNNQVDRQSRALDTLKNSTDKASIAQRAMAGTSSLLNGALNLVGGWLGVVSIAISAGIILWSKWAMAAEDATARANRALQGVSTGEDLSKYRQELAATRAELQALESAPKIQVGRGASTQAAADQFNSQREERRRELKARIAELETNTARAEEAVKRSRFVDVANSIDRSTERGLSQIDAAYSKEIAAINSGIDRKVEAARKAGKKEEEIAKIRAADTERANRVYAEGLQARAKALDTIATNIEQIALKSSGTDSEALIAKAKADRDTAKQLRDQATNILQTIAKPIDLGPPKPKEGTDPLGDLIARLKADREQVETELESLDRLTGRVDRAAAAAAKIQSEFASGKFKMGEAGKKTNPAQSRVEEAKKLAADIERDREIIRDAQSVTNLMRDIGPRYEEAISLLADPLGASRNGRTENATRKALNSMNEDQLKAAAQRLGTTVEEIKSTVGKSMVIDMAPEFQSLVQDAEETERRVTVLTQEEERKRRLGDIEVFRQRQQNRIDDLQKLGGYTEAVKQMQEGLNRWVIAKSAEVNRQNETPLDQMLKRWQKTTDAMNEATARWGEATIDTFVNAVRTGKLQFGDLTRSILADLLKIQLQKQLTPFFDIGLNALGSGMKSFFGFANGGIMTSDGPLPLRKYAAGGIAKSPQMAIYGEGDMAEAFVPLPDGRSIPVTMQGAGNMPNVSVNVINQTGTPVSAQKGTPRFDGRQMVLDVVLSAAATPGPFRDNLRAAMENS